MGIFDWKHWMVILVVVVLVFGTKKLKTLGGDFGGAIKGFREAMKDEEKSAQLPHFEGAQINPRHGEVKHDKTDESVHQNA